MAAFTNAVIKSSTSFHHLNNITRGAKNFVHEQPIIVLDNDQKSAVTIASVRKKFLQKFKRVQMFNNNRNIAFRETLHIESLLSIERPHCSLDDLAIKSVFFLLFLIKTMAMLLLW